MRYSISLLSCLLFQLINSSAYKEFSSIESTATSDLLNQALQRVEEFALAVLACQSPEVRSINIRTYIYIQTHSFINSSPILINPFLYLSRMCWPR